MSKKFKHYFQDAFLVLTTKCNLNCPYCFMQKSNETMSFENAKKIIDFLFAGAKKNNTKKLTITYFGGEPTLCIDLMNNIFDYGKKKEQETGITFMVNIVSNGIIFNKELKNFLLKIKNNQGVVRYQLSIDSIPSIQSIIRPLLNNNGLKTSGQIIEENLNNIVSFAKENNISLENEINIHPVISIQTLPYLFETYKWLIEKGFKYIWHRLIIEEKWEKEHVSEYDKQMHQIYNYLIENNIYSTLGSMANRQKKCWDMRCGAGKGFCTIYPNGDIYPCGHFYNLPNSKQFYLGNVFSKTIIKKNKIFLEDIEKNNKILNSKQCINCECTGCYMCLVYLLDINTNPILRCDVDHSYCELSKIQYHYSKLSYDYLETKKIVEKLNNKNLQL